MNHSQWLAAMEDVTACMGHDPGQAAALLRDLVSRTEVARQAGVSSWHVRQSQCLRAQIEAERGSLAVAAEIHEQAANSAEAELREAKHAAALGFAQSALERFELGETDRAMALSRRALALADVHLDPSITYERLLSEVRRVRQGSSTGGA